MIYIEKRSRGGPPKPIRSGLYGNPANKAGPLPEQMKQLESGIYLDVIGKVLLQHSPGLSTCVKTVTGDNSKDLSETAEY